MPKQKPLIMLIRELTVRYYYADDTVFVAHSVEDMQLIMNHFSFACTVFGLTIRLKKTKKVSTPEPGELCNEPNIVINDTRLDIVDTFVYLGSTLSRDGSLDTEIHLRIPKSSVAFGKLEKRVLSDRTISLKTKISVYKSCVLTTLLYSPLLWLTENRRAPTSEA